MQVNVVLLHSSLRSYRGVKSEVRAVRCLVTSAFWLETSAHYSVSCISLTLTRITFWKTWHKYIKYVNPKYLNQRTRHYWCHTCGVLFVSPQTQRGEIRHCCKLQGSWTATMPSSVHWDNCHLKSRLSLNVKKQQLLNRITINKASHMLENINPQHERFLELKIDIKISPSVTSVSLKTNSLTEE